MMKNRKPVWFFAAGLTLAVLLLSDHGTAQQSSTTNREKGSLPFPVIPAIVEYDYLPLYFMQWIKDDPNYSIVAATIYPGDSPVYQIMLVEKSGGSVYYCNLKTMADNLAREGKQAHFAPIDFKATQSVGQPTTYGFGFRDARGRAIVWRFIPASRPSLLGAGLTPQARNPGFHLMYRHLGTLAGEGTAIQIGDHLNEAEPWPESSSPPYFVAFRGTHADGMDSGALLLGSESWQIVSSPNTADVSELREGAQWVLRETGGRERTFRITELHADEVTITETSAAATGIRSFEMRAQIQPQGFAVREIHLGDGVRAMRLAFTPALNLVPTATEASNPASDFEFDLGKQRHVAQGTVAVERQSGVLLLRWLAKAPEWAKSRGLVSTIKIQASGYTIETSQATESSNP